MFFESAVNFCAQELNLVCRRIHVRLNFNVFRTGIPNHVMSVLKTVSASDIVKGVGDLPDVWSALVLLPHVR